MHCMFFAGVGGAVRVVEGVCDRSSGVLRYAWEVRSADVYRQIEVRCNAGQHEVSEREREREGGREGGREFAKHSCRTIEFVVRCVRQQLKKGK